MTLNSVEQGEGPVVVLVHGFPETSYSWRHQLPALAGAGYRAVAIDVRGYGGSPRPDAIEAYRMLDLVADNVALLRELDAESAVIVGHDWGSPIAANSALLRPDLFPAVAMMGVPYAPRGGPKPTDVFPPDFYVAYFQDAGRAEAEIDPDVRGWLRGYYGSSAYVVGEGGKLSDDFDPELPAWLTEEDFDVYATAFETTGITGALNRYRNMDRDWADLAAWDGAPIRQPSLFVAGADDPSIGWLSDAIDAFPATLPGLRGSHILENCGHWVQQERPEEVNRLLIDWLRTLPG